MDARLAELDRLDRQSEALFTQGLLREATLLAREYGRLKRSLERDFVRCPPSVSLRRIEHVNTNG